MATFISTETALLKKTVVLSRFFVALMHVYRRAKYSEYLVGPPSQLDRRVSYH